MPKAYISGSEEMDVFPYSCVSVPYPVKKCKIPSDSHEHGHVLSYFPIPSVTEFPDGTEGFGVPFSRSSRFIDRIDLYGQYIAVISHVVSDIYCLLHEHSGDEAYHFPVQPEFGPVVYSVGLHPDSFVLSFSDASELRSEPVGVEISAGCAYVRNQTARNPVIDSIVWLRVNAVVNQ